MRQMTNEARAEGARSLCLARRNKGYAQIIDIKSAYLLATTFRQAASLCLQVAERQFVFHQFTTSCPRQIHLPKII
jgi:hypothetical protein